MKKIIVLLSFITIGTFNLIAQPPSPPQDASTGNPGPVGGNAPVGSGVLIMIALSAVYGSKKTYDWHKGKK